MLDRVHVCVRCELKMLIKRSTRYTCTQPVVIFFNLRFVSSFAFSNSQLLSKAIGIFGLFLSFHSICTDSSIFRDVANNEVSVKINRGKIRKLRFLLGKIILVFV